MIEENKSGSKISNVEWGLVIGALFTIDLIQIPLEWLLIGLVINPFVDIFVGMSLALYLHLRGQSLTDPKRIFALIGTFVGEMIPAVDELPLWGLDGIFNMMLSKSDSILGQIPGGAVVSKAIGGKEDTSQKNSGGQKSTSGTDSATRRIPLQSQNYAGAKQPGQSEKTTLDQNKRPPTKQPQQDQKTPNQLAGSEQEINNMKGDLDRWNRELQDLNSQLQKHTQEENDNRKYIDEMIRMKKSQGVEEGEIKELEKGYLRGTGRNVSQLSTRKTQLETMIRSTNNKLLGLERNAKKSK